MKILSSQLQINGHQQNTVLSTQLERLSVSVLNQVEGADEDLPNSDAASIKLSLSNSASEQQSLKTGSTVSVADSGDIIQQHEGLQIAQYVVEHSSEFAMSVSENNRSFVTGPDLRVNNVDIRASSTQVEVEVVSRLTQESVESLTFEAFGQVKTEEGYQIDFMMALDFDRSTHTEIISEFKGNRNLIDPLIINVEGGAVGLSDVSFDFDLNSDGTLESIAQTAKGSGYLVFDKNKNGEIDNGSEMFGPETGQGYGELRQYDEDGNGWIDENDSIYNQLEIMSFGEEGRETQSLLTAGIGALHLGSVESNYQLNTESGIFAGKIKQSGIALAEDGRTLLMQEVHLTDFSSDGASSTEQNRELFLRALSGIDDAAEGGANSASPLRLFQFEDPILLQRDENTQVSITSPDELNITASFNITQAQSGEERSNSGGINKTFDRQAVALELSEWVASAMEGFDSRPEVAQRIEKTQTYVNVEQVKAPIFNQALNDLDLEEMKLESQLSTMRSMIDSLREMRLQLSESNNKLALYHRIDTLGR